MDSMTGYGRAEGSVDPFMVTVEMRSVNHRGLSLSISLPEELAEQEPQVRSVLKDSFKRGRIRVDVSMDLVGDRGGDFNMNFNVVKHYIEAAEELSGLSGIEGSLSPGELLRLPGVIEGTEVSEYDADLLRDTFRDVLRAARDQLASARSSEGSALEPAFRSGFDTIRDLTGPILEVQKSNAGDRFEKLSSRVREMVGDLELDRDRLMQEVAILADRSDVTEEIERLLCHIDHAVETLDSGPGTIGRRLEFIIQEMHRELNTMGAKVDDSKLSYDIVEMKSILAALKEQAANIE